MRIAQVRTAQRRDVRFRDNPFSSVRAQPVRVERVRRCVQASVGPCIPRAPDLRVRVRWELGRDCRLREPPVREVVLAGLRAGRVSATFPVV